MRTCARLLISFFLLTGCKQHAAAADTAQPGNADTVPLADTDKAKPGAGIPVDLSELSDSEKAAFTRLVQRFPSACGKAHSLEVSVKTDPSCRRSVYAARYIARLLKADLLESEVEDHYDVRFNTPKIQIDVASAPVRGDPSAPIALVEFSDFQCPHCKHMQPVLDRVLEEYRGKVKLYFKQYPIGRAHPDAPLAAAAALAAGKQGKFWQFHDRLFADQDHENLAALEKIASDLKLDKKRWTADIETEKEHVARDHADGEKLEVSATPTLYIAGRKFSGPSTFEEVKDWIDEELNK